MYASDETGTKWEMKTNFYFVSLLSGLSFSSEGWIKVVEKIKIFEYNIRLGQYYGLVGIVGNLNNLDFGCKC